MNIRVSTFSSLCLFVALVGCNPKPSRSEGAGSSGALGSAAASAPAEPVSASASVASEAARALRGGVRGTVRIQGDPAPRLDRVASEIPVGKCFLAHDMYSKLFREGEGRTLADVLVAVTEYEGETDPPSPTVRVEAKDCAYDRRTIALTLGQTLAVQNVGTGTHTPQLLGYRAPALILAVPKGDPVEFQPDKLGQYQLVDRTHAFAFADVFVLNYPSVAVTGLDGKFAISGLPPGKAKVSVLLPITGQTLSREVVIPAGRTVEADFEISFDVERDGAKAQLPEPQLPEPQLPEPQ